MRDLLFLIVPSFRAICEQDQGIIVIAKMSSAPDDLMMMMIMMLMMIAYMLDGMAWMQQIIYHNIRRLTDGKPMNCNCPPLRLA